MSADELDDTMWANPTFVNGSQTRLAVPKPARVLVMAVLIFHAGYRHARDGW